MPKSYADKVAYWRNKVTLCIRPKSETHIHHDHSKLMQVNTIEDVRLFTFNVMELAWVQGLSQLSLRLLNWIKTLDGSYQIMMKLAYLLKSSTVVSVENIFHMFSSVASNSTKNDLSKRLLYNLLIYHLSLSSKEYIVNYNETVCSEVSYR